MNGDEMKFRWRHGGTAARSCAGCFPAERDGWLIAQSISARPALACSCRLRLRRITDEQ